MSYQEVRVEQLRSSSLNPRTHFDPAKLEELGASLAGVGVIEPLVVRKNGAANGFEIVAGERRYRAAKLAQLASVPVIVRELTDAQVLEIMVVENNQREDVNPLEEAEGFARLLKTGYDLDKLAERIGRSKKYIYDRVKLRDLVPTAQHLLLDGKLTAGHGILLARLKPEDQSRALDVEDGGAFEGDRAATEEEEEAREAACDAKADAKAAGGPLVAEYNRAAYGAVKSKSVRELSSWIANHVRFNVQQAAAAAPLDFGEVAQRVDQAAAKPGRGKKVIAITFASFVQPEARDEGERTYGPRSFKFADGQEHVEDYPRRQYTAKRCDHAVLGVVVAGEQYGKAFDICIARDRCQVHWKAEIADREKNQKLRERGQGAKAAKREANSYAAQQEQWKREQEVRDRCRQAWEGVRARALDAAAVALKKAGPNGRVIEALMSSVRLYDKKDRELVVKHFGKVTAQNVAVALLFTMILDDNSRTFDEFQKVVKAFGVDLKALEAEYRAAAAPPKEASKVVQTSALKAATKKAGKKR